MLTDYGPLCIERPRDRKAASSRNSSANTNTISPPATTLQTAFSLRSASQFEKIQTAISRTLGVDQVSPLFTVLAVFTTPRFLQATVKRFRIGQE